MEIKCSVNKLKDIRRRVGFSSCFVVSLVGKKGGLALLWNGDINLEILNYSSSQITSIIRDTDLAWEWSLTGFYGLPETHRRFES